MTGLRNVQELDGEGVHANGFVTVLPLPEEVYGSQARKVLPLRRMEAIVGEGEAEQHFRKELMKVEMQNPETLPICGWKTVHCRRCRLDSCLPRGGLH